MRVTIHPGRLRGHVQAPPSKSHAHRALICAALADGETLLTGAGASRDIEATARCLTALGATDRARGRQPARAAHRRPTEKRPAGLRRKRLDAALPPAPLRAARLRRDAHWPWPPARAPQRPAALNGPARPRRGLCRRGPAPDGLRRAARRGIPPAGRRLQPVLHRPAPRPAAACGGQRTCGRYAAGIRPLYRPDPLGHARLRRIRGKDAARLPRPRPSALPNAGQSARRRATGRARPSGWRPTRWAAASPWMASTPLPRRATAPRKGCFRPENARLRGRARRAGPHAGAGGGDGRRARQTPHHRRGAPAHQGERPLARHGRSPARPRRLRGGSAGWPHRRRPLPQGRHEWTAAATTAW